MPSLVLCDFWQTFKATAESQAYFDSLTRLAVHKAMPTARVSIVASETLSDLEAAALAFPMQWM